MLRLGSKFTLTAVLFCLVSFNAQSRTFKNAYISFEMQDNWNCKLEQTEWVCRSENPQEAKEAVIILTAKEKGPTDSFPIYQTHMNNIINTVTRVGTPMSSIVKYKSIQVKINEQDWLDGLHQDSEVKNYFTRYLATIKDQIAILVTFSAHNQHYAKYSQNFNKTIQSLRVIATKDLISRPEMGPIAGQNDILGGNVSNTLNNIVAADEGSAKAGGKKGFLKNEFVLGLALFILAILIYIGLRIYQKTKK